MYRRPKCLGLAALVITILWPTALWAAEPLVPGVSLSVNGEELNSDEGFSSLFKLVFLISAMSFIPALVLSTTCFTRFAVVLGMTRTALGTQSLPPNMVITGLALFLTIAVMRPVFAEMYEKGVKPFSDGQMTEAEAWRESTKPLKAFLVRHARDKDLMLFLEITQSEPPEDAEEVPFLVAVPAFVLSELNTAFQIGFMIALPFLVLDMVVSSVLTSMSMITLPPVVISLPLKLMLFVIVDGWYLIIGSLVRSYTVVT